MAKKKHGMTGTRFHNIYLGILRRCNCPSMTGYKLYGGRGIKCEWNSFEEFRDDMYKSYLEHTLKFGERNTTIDRINVDGNYCKGNCRWATIKEQHNNTRTNVRVKYGEVEYPSIQLLCESLGLKYNTLYKRVFLQGQDTKQAIDEMIAKKQKYEYKGVRYKGITDMCRKLGLKRTSIAYRLKIGMSIEDAIEQAFTLDKRV